jgi:hypothetical protein
MVIPGSQAATKITIAARQTITTRLTIRSLRKKTPWRRRFYTFSVYYEKESREMTNEVRHDSAQPTIDNKEPRTYKTGPRYILRLTVQY